MTSSQNMLNMHYSLDKNLSSGTPTNVLHSIDVHQNYSTGSIFCEQKYHEQSTKVKVKSESSLPDLISSSMGLLFGFISSTQHRPVFSSSVPSMKLSIDIPSQRLYKDLTSLIGGHATFLNHLEKHPSVRTELKNIVSPFLTSSTTNVAFVASVNDSGSNSNSDDSGNSSPLIKTSDTLCTAVAGPTDLRGPQTDAEEDVLSVSEDDSDSESGGYSSESDEDYEDDDDEWDEGDERYSAFSTVTFESNTCRSSSYSMDTNMARWDPGIDDELMMLPKNSVPTFALDSSNEDDKILAEANERWNDFYSSCRRKRKNNNHLKEVSFASAESLVTVHSWEDSEGCRAGPWQQFALDRCRFRRRIEEFEKTFSEILQIDRRNCAYTRNSTFESQS